MPCRFAAASAAILILLPTSASSADTLLEIEVGGNAYVGRSVVHDQSHCWLLEQDGHLRQIPLDAVTSYRKVSNTFRPISTSALRSSLREELGREYEVTNLGEFVVAAPQGQARPYAELLDNVYRSFVRFFSRRSLRLTEPEVPLVAIVFADANQFADYCRQDSVRYSPTLRGYYQPDTNRVALYDPVEGLAIRPTANAAELAVLSPSEDRLTLFDAESNEFASIQGGLRDTLVHEATHQLAFNMGLHSRIARNPRWVIEGLAMIFERQVSSTQGNAQSQAINRDRFEWFNRRVRPEWTSGSLKDYLGSDRPFTTNALDSYSLAWALTYYLSVRRSADFAQYLQEIRERDPSSRDTPEVRLAEFQRSFGDDIDWFEVELLRYIDGLE